MAQQQLRPVMVGGGHRMGGGWLAALGAFLVVVVALVLAGSLARPGTTAETAPYTQPAIGRSMVVTGLVFDGSRYTSAPIAVGAAPYGSSYTVTAPVWDGTRYRTEPVQVGGS